MANDLDSQLGGDRENISEDCIEMWLNMDKGDVGCQILSQEEEKTSIEMIC